MGKASVPKRGKAGKTRPLRSDSQPRGMPTIALGKSKKAKAKPVIAKKGKVQLRPAKVKPKVKQSTETEDSDTASVVSARGRRSAAPDSDASTSRSPNESKRSKVTKASADRAESPASTRLSRSSSASSFAGKVSDTKKTIQGNAEKGKAKSPVSTQGVKGILNYFNKVSPNSKGPVGNKKAVKTVKKAKDTVTQKGTSSLNSSPDSVNSGSSRSNQVSSELLEDDDSVLDDNESCVESQSEDLDAPNGDHATTNDSGSKTVNGSDISNQKSLPKLTKKNINELFPSDDSMSRLRSNSPASQKSTRSLVLQRSSPKATGSGVISSRSSDSAIRALKNGNLKRFALTDSVSSKKKKKRVYAGKVSEEDRIDDSRSDFSDGQSSIFSESDSSSFIDSFSRSKNNDMEDKMETEEIPGSMSNDEDDLVPGRINSPNQWSQNQSREQASSLTSTDKNSTLASADGQIANETSTVSSPCLAEESGSTGEEKDSDKEIPQQPKSDILNNIQSEWDSDGDVNEEESDNWHPESPKEGCSAFDELLSNTEVPQANDKESEKNKTETDSSTEKESDKNVSGQKQNSSLASTSDSSKTDSQSVLSTTNRDKPSSDQVHSSHSQAKVSEPVPIKNGFSEFVDFVAKRHRRIDFESLRRRTKRSMSANLDGSDKSQSASEKSQNHRILAIDPSKIHGKPALVWTVKAVREPIIPKSVKSPDKGFVKSDSQENKNTTSVKPMVESTQNDNTATPKIAPDSVLTASFPINSSSVKENIMVQTSPKQSPGKSPSKDSGVSGSCSKPAVKLVSEVKCDNSGNIASEKETVADISKDALPSLDSSLATSAQKSQEVPEDSSALSETAAVKEGTAASKIVDAPVTDTISVVTPVTVPVSVSSDIPLAEPVTVPMSVSTDISVVEPVTSPTSVSTDIAVVAPVSAPVKETIAEINSDASVPCIAVVTPVTAPIKETNIEVNSDAPVSASEGAAEAPDADDRCSTPLQTHTPMQEDIDSNLDRTFDDGESFHLRLSPTPTKEDLNRSNHSTISTSPVKGCSSFDEVEPLSSEKREKEGRNIVHDLEKTLTEEETPTDENVISKDKPMDEVEPKTENQSLQLIIRKKGQSRPRSLSADCNLSSMTFNHEDIWVVKNGDRSSSGATVEEEDEEEKEANEIASDKTGNKDGQLRASTDICMEGSGDTPSSNMTVECSNIRVKQPGLLSPRLEADVERLNLELHDIEKKRREITEEEQSPEKKAIKEWVLSSLGLQSVAAAAAAAAAASARPSKRRSQDGLVPSSGRLKAVIKIPQGSKRDKKSDRKPLRMVFKNGKPVEETRSTSDADSSFKSEGNTSADISSNSFTFNGSDHGSSESSLQTPETEGAGKTGANLVIPEKSSSFSIHPGRLCSDVCSYCFGKFGSLDTPCHVAQLKSRERQMKIMSVETHLALDSCLCDACIRYVDRKANCPSSKPQTSHRKGKFEGSMSTCIVAGCVQPARHSLRKKWYIKIRKSVMPKCPIDLELAHQHLPLPLCPEHFNYMEYFMVCGLCKRRLSRSHMYNLVNTHEINTCLEHDGIPARLSEQLFVCKLCRYYATLRVKHQGSQLTQSQRVFFTQYRKRILTNHDIEVSESEDDEEGGGHDPEVPDEEASAEDGVAPAVTAAAADAVPPALPAPPAPPAAAAPAAAAAPEDALPKGKRKRAGSNATAATPAEADAAEHPKKKSRHSEPAAKSKEKEEKKGEGKGHKGGKAARAQAVSQAQARQEAEEWVRKGMPPFYPGEDEMALHATFQFQYDDEPSGNRAWEKCTSMLQFDKDTKRLWQELQRPYGSQSSFLRHLVLMERYWREGELVLASDASTKAATYTRSVQNRLKAYGSSITVKAPAAPAAAATATATAATASAPAARAATPVGVPVGAPKVTLPTAQPAPLASARPPNQVAVKAVAAAPSPPHRVTIAPALASAAVPALPKPDVALALTGGTVLTAAAAAAAVTAVHLSSSLSPSSDAAPSRAGHAALQAAGPAAPKQTVKQPKQQAKPASKSQLQQQSAQQARTQQGKGAGKVQQQQQQAKALPSKVPTIQVKSVMALQKPAQPAQAQPSQAQPAQPVLKTPPIRLAVKAPIPVQEVAPTTKQMSQSDSVAISLEHCPLVPVSVGSGVTITPEPKDKSSSPIGKLIPILPKSQISIGGRATSSPWEPTSSTSRSPFNSTSPVVNLTRSISLTAVPTSPPPMPDLHPINSQLSRPSRSPSTASPVVTVSPQRSSPGAYVSIIPTTASRAALPKPPPPALLDRPASITPIYTSQSLPTSVTVTSSVTTTAAPSSVVPPSPTVIRNKARPPRVQVTTSCGKSFTLTIPAYKKLKALRERRQQKEQNELKEKAAKEERERMGNSVPSGKEELEVVEVRDSDSDAPPTLPTISAICSGDQAKAMWNEVSRTPDSSIGSVTSNDSSISFSPVVEITPILGSKSNISVESLPKIPKTLTVTQIRKESPTFSKTVASSGVSLTITRQKCQTPMAPSMSSPALDIFPS